MSLSSSSSSSSRASGTTSVSHLNGWISFGIPFRPSRGTYELFDAKTLPPIETKEFNHLKTLADVKGAADFLDEQLQSCTASYVKVDEEAKSFYRDQQDCCVWYFDPLIGVYLTMDVDSSSRRRPTDKDKDDKDTSRSSFIVAHSLAEFFARLKMENDIWHKSAACLHPDAFASYKCLWDEQVKDPQGLWTTLCEVLTTAEQTYLGDYYRSSAKKNKA